MQLLRSPPLRSPGFRLRRPPLRWPASTAPGGGSSPAARPPAVRGSSTTTPITRRRSAPRWRQRRRLEPTAASLLERELRDGDVLLTLGAGNIDSLAARLAA